MRRITKIIVPIITSLLLFVGLAFHNSSSIFASSSSTTPKITIHNYKDNKNFQYAVISGKEYDAANYQMLKYVASIYEADQKLRNENPQYSSYSISKVLYNQDDKISISYINAFYKGGVQEDVTMTVFNFYKGKNITLKKAFKDTTAYNEANKYVKNYIMNHPYMYPLANQNIKMYNHQFYWTPTGMNIVFDPNQLDSLAAGFKYVPVPQRFLKH